MEAPIDIEKLVLSSLYFCITGSTSPNLKLSLSLWSNTLYGFIQSQGTFRSECRPVLDNVS
jgi:hypothetical protein